MGFKNDDYINVYMGGSHKISFAGALPNEGEYVLDGITDDGFKSYVPVSYATLVKLNRGDSIKKQVIRIEESMEEEVLKSLRIDLDKERYSYSEEDMEYMILNSNDEIIREIVHIKDKRIVERFLSVLVGLKSTNQYDISNKLEQYIRGRLEELDEGTLETQFEVTDTLNQRNIETAIVSDEEVKDDNLEYKKESETKNEKDEVKKDEKKSSKTENKKTTSRSKSTK